MKRTIIIVALLLIAVSFYTWQKSESGITNKELGNTNSVDTSNWKTYTNTKYNFSFKFPPNLIIRGSDGYESAEKDLPVASAIFLLDPAKESDKLANHDFEFTVRAYDSEYKIVIPFVDLDLRGFTEKMWQLNKNEDKQDNIAKAQIDGQQAYQFAIASNPNKGFTDGDLSIVLAGENTMIITSKGNSKFVIYFPINNSLSQYILSNFKFTK